MIGRYCCRRRSIIVVHQQQRQQITIVGSNILRVANFSRAARPRLLSFPLHLPRPQQQAAALMSSSSSSSERKETKEEKIEENGKKERVPSESPPSPPTPLPPPPSAAVVPPEKPLPGDCCGSGCVRCVWDIYYEELEAYNNLIAAASNTRQEKRDE